MVLTQQRNLHLFSAFGYTLCSREVLSPWLANTRQLPVDVYIRRIRLPLFSLKDENRLFCNPLLFKGQPISQIYREGNLWGLQLAQVGTFFITPREISFIPDSLDYSSFFQATLLSRVFAFWLELLGLRTLHGAALAWQKHAFVLLADSTGGKSTLAAGLLKNGARLLSDDITVVEANGTGFRLRPGYASMRLRFDQVELFLGQQSNLAKFLPGMDKAIIPIGNHGWARLEEHCQPPTCFYILERQLPGHSAGIEIQTLDHTEAVLALVRHSFVHHAPIFTGTSVERLEFITQLASQVPVKRLVYPSGFKYLSAVCEAIQCDLAAVFLPANLYR